MREFKKKLKKFLKPLTKNMPVLGRMYRLVRYPSYLRAYWSKSRPLAKRYHLPVMYFFLDRIWSFVVHGATIQDDYDLFGFYRLREFERRNFFTHGRYPLTCKWFFPQSMVDAVDSRKGFAENFREFHKRDMLILPCSEEEVLTFAKKHGKIYAKENISLCGMGIFPYTIDELTKDPELLRKVANMDGAAEEPIIQHPVMARLNPNAVSTLRITTLVEKSGDIKIMGIILRIGPLDKFLDNVAQGGYFFEVDINEGIVVGWGRDENANRTLRAPTGVIVPGLVIPFWDQVISETIAAAKKFPEARLVGWDVAICEKGPVFVEANNSTGPLTVQFGDYGCWNYLKSQR